MNIVRLLDIYGDELCNKIRDGKSEWCGIDGTNKSSSQSVLMRLNTSLTCVDYNISIDNDCSRALTYVHYEKMI